MNLTSRMNFLSRSLVPVFALASAAALHAAPDNDSFANRAELFAGPAVTASNAGATLDADEVIPAGYAAGGYAASLWWHWQPVFSGWYEITTTGSSIDTVLSVWTSASEDSPLSLVHVNGTTIQFYADNRTDYKVVVAGQGSTGAVSLRASFIPDPFANIVAAQFDQTVVDVSNGAAASKATLTIEASRELAEGTFNLIDPAGLQVASVPFSAANRVSGNVAHGEYEVSFTLPAAIQAGGYSWNVSVANAAKNKVASQGAGGFSPLGASSDALLTVVNNGVVDGYAQWVAEQGGGDLASLIGGSESYAGALSLDRYAFGLNPSDAVQPLVVSDGVLEQTGAPLITAVTGADGEKRLVVEYSRRKNSAKLGVAYRVQFSDDLVQWDDATTPASVLASDALFEAVSVPDTVTAEDTTQRFARVLVERSVP